MNVASSRKKRIRIQYLACALAFGCLLSCSGGSAIKVTEAITGPYAFVYREVTGDYANNAAVFVELHAGLKEQGISSLRSIAIFLDDPKRVPAMKRRCICGAVIEESDWDKIDKLGGSFQVQHICRARSLVAERRSQGPDGSGGGSEPYYTALTRYAARKGYAALNSFELYEGDSTSYTTTYVMSTSDPRSAYPPTQAAASSSQSGAASWPDPDWQASTPEEEGMSSRVLLRSLDRLTGMFGSDVLDSLVIIRHGKMVAEVTMAPNEPNLRHEAHSATKSVLGALVGIAIRQGFIRSMHDRVVDYFPGEKFENMDDRKRKMTIGDLLDMTSGLSFPHTPLANGLPAEVALRRSDDWARFALGRPMEAQPGKRFNYSASDPNILSAIITKTTGMNAKAFAERELFGPLGIENVAWEEAPRGNTVGDDGLYLCPRDMAKIGYLFLRDGLWERERILPPGWASGILSGSTKTGLGAPYYSRYWWIDPSRSFYSACGAGGQFIMVFPREDLVVVVTAKDLLSFDNYFAYHSFVEIAHELILPAVQSDGRLPPDPEAGRALAERIGGLAREAKSAPPKAPIMAARVSGRLWSLDANDIGLRTARLRLGADTAVMELGTDASTLAFPIGLDGRYRKSGWIGHALSGVGGIYASKGRWDGDGTFVVYFRVLEGDWGGETRFAFDAEQLHLTFVFSDPFYWSTTIAGR